MSPLPPIETDALVIGAGPAGLFQVFELGLLEIHAHVVDALPAVGGQCIELYPDKPIYDIPGLPVCTGRELVARLSQQIAPFGASFHLNQQVAAIERQAADGVFKVTTSTGQGFLAKTIFIAGGVGAFLPRPLKVQGIEPFVDQQVFHQLDRPERFAGQSVVITGGGEAALRAVLQLAELGEGLRPRSLVLLHRRDVFQADAALIDRVQQLRDAGQLRFVAGQITGLSEQDGRLQDLQITDAEAQVHALPLDALLALLGVSPRLGPIADWGLDMERRQLRVDTEKFQTSEAGIFAVGDVNTYPGKKKLILSGFHEATLAAFAAAALIHPDRSTQLQYTTTSTQLHRVLGVAHAPAHSAD